MPDSVDGELQVIWAVTGKVFGQVEALTGIRIGASAEVGIVELSAGVSVKGAGFDVQERKTISLDCLPSCVVAQGGPSPSTGDNVNKFSWIDDARLSIDQESSNGMADGLAIANLYGSNFKPHEAWDFFASSQASSVTPQNGHRITKLLMDLRPDNNNISAVEADPLSVGKYGSAGSFSLGASLEGEAKFGNVGGGGSFNIGRTWNFAEGTVGGGWLSDGTHYTQWQSGNKSGSTTAKSAQGVETWKVPTDSGITLWYSGSVWIK